MTLLVVVLEIVQRSLLPDSPPYLRGKDILLEDSLSPCLSYVPLFNRSYESYDPPLSS